MLAFPLATAGTAAMVGGGTSAAGGVNLDLGRVPALARLATLIQGVLTIEPAFARGNGREAAATVRLIVGMTAMTGLAWFVLLLWPLEGRNSWSTARLVVGAVGGNS